MGAMSSSMKIRAGLLHSSDLDPSKPANWKRQVKTCGQIGVMGDLGMHVVHIPFRLGWQPKRVYAQLQKIYPERPDGKGGLAACDTWDNATLHTDLNIHGAEVPMRLEMSMSASTRWRPRCQAETPFMTSLIRDRPAIRAMA